MKRTRKSKNEKIYISRKQTATPSAKAKKQSQRKRNNRFKKKVHGFEISEK